MDEITKVENEKSNIIAEDKSTEGTKKVTEEAENGWGDNTLQDAKVGSEDKSGAESNKDKTEGGRDEPRKDTKVDSEDKSVTESSRDKPESGWDEARKDANGTKSKTTEESGWGEPTDGNTESAWDAPSAKDTGTTWDASAGDVGTTWDASSTAPQTSESNYSNRERAYDRPPRERPYDRNYGARDEGRGYRGRDEGREFPRKRYDDTRSEYNLEKRFRADRDEGRERFGNREYSNYGSREQPSRDADRDSGYAQSDRLSGYAPRDREYPQREREYGSRSRDYPPRDREYGSRYRDYLPRDREYGSRGRDYSPRDREYGSRDEGYGRRGGDRDYDRNDGGYGPRESTWKSGDAGYERSSRDTYERSERSSYDPMSDSGRPFTPRPKKVIPQDVPPSKALGLFGLSLYATEEDLREFLSDELQDIKDWKITIITDHVTKKSKGFGFVYFQSLEDSIRAKELLTGKAIKGKEVRVDFSVSDVLRPNYR